ncbi:hypothetical protein LSCM4_04689 [Leishmania orientalis]|uniref:Uncharacterized protein n=1 Tax=Leishmania orientalis TaxID=2249476 RepID=A0A836GNM9_9TRYP|nr:hypothetical protein LSCM4_04689 [Leishmania orientalis]
MSSLHQLLHRRDSVAKPLLRSPASCASLSDCARGFTDDTGGVTRSSLTQESLHYDSCSRTWSSSFSASVSGLPMQSVSRVHATPSRSMSTIKSKAAAVLVAESTLAIAGDGSQTLPMDVFDVALAHDVQQRRARQHHQRCFEKTDELKGKSGKDTIRGAVPLPKAAGNVSSGAHSTLFSGAVEVLRTPRCSQHLPTCVPTCGEALCAIIHPLACATDARGAFALPQHQQLCSSSPAVGLPFSYGTSGDQNLRSAGDRYSSSAASLSLREENIRRLRGLLSETLTLHEALWQQLCELQHMEEKERCRSARSMLARRSC